MSKSFIEALVLLGLALLLVACGSTGERKPSMGKRGVQTTTASLPVAAGPAPEVAPANLVAFNEAVAAIREERLGDAEILLLAITVDQPELAGPWINLGQIYVTQEDFENAQLAFEQAVGANPHNCIARNELAVLLRRSGKFSTAEAHYRACIEVTPGFKEAYLNLGILYELYFGRLADALDLYRHYQTLLPEPDRRVQGWVMDLERRVGS